jgi:hypothetical protein
MLSKGGDNVFVTTISNFYCPFRNDECVLECALRVNLGNVSKCSLGYQYTSAVLEEKILKLLEEKSIK